jgi:hypothetical protein
MLSDSCFKRLCLLSNSQDDMRKPTIFPSWYDMGIGVEHSDWLFLITCQVLCQVTKSAVVYDDWLSCLLLAKSIIKDTGHYYLKKLALILLHIWAYCSDMKAATAFN